MEAKIVILAMFLAVAVLNLSHPVSARVLFKARVDLGTTSPGQQSKGLETANGEHIDENAVPGSYSSTKYQNLDEVDRLRLSINKLICGTMEEGCDHMDDAADHSDTTDRMTESFASLNPHDHVKEY